MDDVVCKLLSQKYLKDENGNILKDENGRERFKIDEREVPLISVDRVWGDEYYKGNAQGLRPSLRFKMNALNYEGEERLIYMGEEYELIRPDRTNQSEITLICQRRSNNVKQ